MEEVYIRPMHFHADPYSLDVSRRKCSDQEILATIEIPLNQTTMQALINPKIVKRDISVYGAKDDDLRYVVEIFASHDDFVSGEKGLAVVARAEFTSEGLRGRRD